MSTRLAALMSNNHREGKPNVTPTSFAERFQRTPVILHTNEPENVDLTASTSTTLAPHGEEARPLMTKAALPTTGGTYKDFTKRVEALKTQLPTLIEHSAFQDPEYLRELADEIASAEPRARRQAKEISTLQLHLQLLSEGKEVAPEAKSTVDLINNGLLALWNVGEHGIAELVLHSLESKVAETTKP